MDNKNGITNMGIDLTQFPEKEEYLDWIKGFTQFPHRRTGTMEGLKSAQYVKETFEKLGLSEVKIEEEPSFLYQTEEYGLTVKGIEMPCFYINGTLREADEGTFEMGETGLGKEIVYLSEGRESDFEGIDVKDKIVMCDCPWLDSNEETYASNWCKNGAFTYDPQNLSAKKLGRKKDSYSPYMWPYNYCRAIKGGAAGFIGILTDYIDDGIFYNEDYTEEIQSNGVTYPELGGLWVGNSVGRKIKEMINSSDEPVIADMKLKNTYKQGIARNIVGILPGSSSEIILVHSHHDAVFSGAVQDASGMSEVFGLAKYYSQMSIEQRAKTLMFAALDSHYTDYSGHQGFIKRRRLNGDKIILDVVTEHISKEIVIGKDNEVIETGEVEIRLLYVTNVGKLWDITKDAIIRNHIERTIMFPVQEFNPAEKKEKYEFQQDEVISDGYYSQQAGIPVISILSPPMYLFHPMDTIEMVALDQLRPIGITFAEIINGVSKLGIPEYK